jgi:hypothetical protein
LLGQLDATVHGGGQAVAEEGPSLVQGDLFTGGQHRSRRRRLRRLPQLRAEGDGLFQAEPLGLIPVFNR